MFKLSSIAFAAIVAAGPALATGEVYCEVPDEPGAIFGYGFGHVPGLAIVSATIKARGQHWSMLDAEGAIPIIVAQGARDSGQTIIDFADPNFTRIIASVRLVSTAEGDEFITAGTLRISDVGVFPLVCD